MRNLLRNTLPLLATVIAIACSPVQGKFKSAAGAAAKNPASQPSAPPSQTPPASPESAIAGDWICKDGQQTCPFALISIASNGNAMAVSSMENSDCEFQHEAKMAITQENNQFHLELAVLETGSIVSSPDCQAIAGVSSMSESLNADLPLGQIISELKFEKVTYIRKPVSK